MFFVQKAEKGRKSKKIDVNLRSCSNIKFKSWNNTYLNIMELLFLLYIDLESYSPLLTFSLDCKENTM